MTDLEAAVELLRSAVRVGRSREMLRLVMGVYGIELAGRAFLEVLEEMEA